MSDTATMLEPIIDVNAQAYRQGYAAGYMKAKAEMAAKPKPQRTTKSPADKKLEQDISKAMAALNALERWRPDSWTAAKPEIMQAAVDSEILRLQRAIADPALLWRIYRRNDKGPSYVEVNQ